MTHPPGSAVARGGPLRHWPASDDAALRDRDAATSALRHVPNVLDPRFVRIVRRRDVFAHEGDATADFGTPGDGAIAWARWRWDGRELIAETCRYGIRSLFYHAGPDRILIAPSIEKLLALGAPVELDPEALAVFLRFENFLGEDTPFKHIRALPPNCRLTWSGTLRLSGDYRRVEPHAPSRHVALDVDAARFRDAVEHAVAVPALVPLSGGCDSRHIAFELARRNRIAECVSLRSLPPRSDDDVRVAGQVAAALGVRHTVLGQDQDRFAATVAATVGTSYCGREHVWFQRFKSFLEGEAAERVTADTPLVDGLGGDVLSAGLFLEPTALDLFRRGQLEALARHYLRGHLGRLPFIADPDFAPAELAVARIMRELELHQHAPNPVASFFFWTRTRRVVALQFHTMLGPRGARTPYLDPAVFDFLAGLPPEMFLDHRFHREAMHRAFPQYARIEFANHHGQHTGTPAHFRRYGRAIMRRFDSHPSRVVDMRYARPRMRYLAWSGSRRACWTPEACLYLNLLEYAGKVA